MGVFYCCYLNCQYSIWSYSIVWYSNGGIQLGVIVMSWYLNVWYYIGWYSNGGIQLGVIVMSWYLNLCYSIGRYLNGSYTNEFILCI